MRGVFGRKTIPKAQGTRFIVQMPQALELLEDISDDKMPQAVYSAPLEAEHVAETVAELPEEKKGGSKHGRILVVEDETTIRRYLHGEFAGEYHVSECSNGQEAWDYIVQNVEKVDLVVSDVMSRSWTVLRFACKQGEFQYEPYSCDSVDG